jgi:hypothetical protein
MKCDLAPYDNAWLWTVVFPDGKTNVLGIWSDHVDHHTVDEKAVIRRVQGMSYVKGKTMQLISIIDPKSCAPISTERHGVDGSVYKRMFSRSNIVTESTTATGEHQTATVEVDTPVFAFNDGQDALLLASLPLRPGYEANINSIDEMTVSNKVKPIGIRVLRKEIVRDSRGRTSAFVVETSDAESKSTLWISKKPPYYLRLEVVFSDNRYRFMFERI